MITYFDACLIAYNYYKNSLNAVGLSEAREAEGCYIFGAGKCNSANIGGAVICVQKNDGFVSVLKFPSKESSALYRTAVKIEVPDDFLCR